MIQHFMKAVGQLSDPKTRAVLWKSIGCSLVTLIIALAVAGVALGRIDVSEYEWIDTALAIAGFFAVFVVAMLLFPGAVSIVTGFFLEDVARACEARHYPGLPATREQGVTEALGISVRFAVVMIAVNLLLAPVYLVLFFLPPLNLVLYYLVNGYLAGREYYELVALRRLDVQAAARLRKRFRGRVWLAGAGIAFLLTIPFVNLLAPLLGTAFMMHVFEDLRRKAGES